MAKMPKIKRANFLGCGSVQSNDTGLVPNESQGMGMYYGTGVKNPQGTLRDGTVGFLPVSTKQLGTPPMSVV
jgi:hypothetical protein